MQSNFDPPIVVPMRPKQTQGPGINHYFDETFDKDFKKIVNYHICGIGNN